MTVPRSSRGRTRRTSGTDAHFRWIRAIRDGSPGTRPCMGGLGRDLTDLRRESSAQHVSLLERNPLACPPLSGTTIGRVTLAGAPSLAVTVVQRFELEEMPLMHLRLGRPDVIPFDAQRADDASIDASLLQNFPDNGGLSLDPPALWSRRAPGHRRSRAGRRRALRDRDAVLTGPGHSHDIVAELLGAGSGHDAHPSGPPVGKPDQMSPDRAAIPHHVS